MKLSIAETKYLKEPVGIISDLVSEAKFNITKDSIELIAMDPANVAMVVFKLLSTAFIDYDVKENVSIAINLSNLKQVLRRVKGNDILSLEVDDNKLKITLKSNNIRTFFLPIIDVEEKEQKIPDLKFATTIVCPSSTLNDAIDDVDIIGESVAFIGEEKKFTVSATGDLSKAQIEISPDSETKIVSKEKTRSKYSIEYLKKMIQGSKISDKVTINFSKDYPLKLDYMTINKVSLSFILAPRVENE